MEINFQELLNNIGITSERRGLDGRFL